MNFRLNGLTGLNANCHKKNYFKKTGSTTLHPISIP